MAQTSVVDEPVRAYEGKLQDRAGRIESGIASATVFFGKAVSRPVTGSLTQLPPPCNLYNGTEHFLGVAAADVSVERLPGTTGIINQANYGAYLANTTVPRLTKGRIWVVSADAVDSLAKSVFTRNATPAGTAATITDTTTYAAPDQDGLTSIVTIVDGGVGSAAGAQTVTFVGATTTAAKVASDMNDQLVGCSVAVVGGQVKITTDATGAGVTIAVAAGTGNLTWGTPVAGTGVPSTMPENAQGSFRATSATGYIDLGAIAPVRWEAQATIGGVNYGLLDINLPS
jgi:hypothetical protein